MKMKCKHTFEVIKQSQHMYISAYSFEQIYMRVFFNACVEKRKTLVNTH